jgi:hypothetical protein
LCGLCVFGQPGAAGAAIAWGDEAVEPGIGCFVDWCWRLGCQPLGHFSFFCSHEDCVVAGVPPCLGFSLGRFQLFERDKKGGPFAGAAFFVFCQAVD